MYAAPPSTTSSSLEIYAASNGGFEHMMFTVPPPTTYDAGNGPSVCCTCGRTYPKPSSEEEHRTLALQLRAAAIFKTELPPMNVPPPSYPALPSYPSSSTTHYGQEDNVAASYCSCRPQSAAVCPYHHHHHSLSEYTPTSTGCSSTTSVLSSTDVPISSNLSPSGDSSSLTPPLVPSEESVLAPDCLNNGTTLSVCPKCICSYCGLPPKFPSSYKCEQSECSSNNGCETTDGAVRGMKRESEMEGETPVKRYRPAGDTELRLVIQSKAAGSVIGKGGNNISRLRSQYPASITVPDCPGPERVLTIGGTADVVVKVLEEIIHCLDEALQKTGSPSPESDLRILAHQSQAGCIIGKGGVKIKELRELCGGQVKVYTSCCPQSTDRIVQVIGQKDRIIMTVSKILDLMKESPVKGINNPYDPHNFDEFFAQEYGGWGEMPKGRFPPMNRGPPPMGPMGRGPMGPSGPLGPPGGPPPFNRRGNYPPPRMGPLSMRGSNNYDKPKNAFVNGRENGDIPTSTQVTIPKDAAGAIIGKGGARIRKIRADSGATISIDDSKPGCNDRIITISGTDPQIRHAQYLLQQSVREFGGPSLRRY